MIPAFMRAMTVAPGGATLLATRRPVPQPRGHEVLLRVLACGVCRTDLHIVDGELPPHRAGVIPGHEVVGRVLARGPQAKQFAIGQRIGTPRLA
jgi:propanol-preferring alcohol dehydrogenase